MTISSSAPKITSVSDVPNDDGSAILISWKTPGLNKKQKVANMEYVILRSEQPHGPFTPVGYASLDKTEYRDSGSRMLKDGSKSKPVERGKDYYYRVAFQISQLITRESKTAGPVQAKSQWYHTGKTPILIATILFFLLVVSYIAYARNHSESLFVRPIAGMSEIDNAIGRATEMGKPILYILGLGSPDDIATIASYTILARVARKTAEYRTELIVPCNDPIVMNIAQETVKNAYLEAGYPESYSDDMVFFITSMQFAYVAAVNGLMLREKTATNCYFGKFYAESLLLSETGNIAGSIQVAGTDEVAQLPFFVTTCDYTLIGEELYAASAYLGRDPLLLGALKAQDYAKAITMILIILGAVLMSFDIDWVLKLITVNL